MITALAWLAVVALLASPLGFFGCCCASCGVKIQLRCLPGPTCPVAGVLVTIKDPVTGSTIWSDTTDASGNVTVPAGTLTAGVTYNNNTFVKSNWAVRTAGSFFFGNGTFTYSCPGDGSDQVVTVVIIPDYVVLTYTDGSGGSVHLDYFGDSNGPVYRGAYDLTDTVVCPTGSFGGPCGTPASGSYGVFALFSWSTLTPSSRISNCQIAWATYLCFPSFVTYFYPLTSAGDQCGFGASANASASETRSNSGCLPLTYTMTGGGSPAPIKTVTIALP